jgi:hypothetical protein
MFCSTLAGKGVGVNRKTAGMKGRGKRTGCAGRWLQAVSEYNIQWGKAWLTIPDSNLHPQ